jgi:hypothetical protein
VKGKSPQEPGVAVQIEQYLLCSAAKLTSCSSPICCGSVVTHFKHAATSLMCRRRKPAVETSVDNTAKLRLKASVLALRAAGASQLLKPASTAP